MVSGAAGAGRGLSSQEVFERESRYMMMMMMIMMMMMRRAGTGPPTTSPCRWPWPGGGASTSGMWRGRNILTSSQPTLPSIR